MSQLAVTVRFLLELCGIAAVAFWGYSAVDGPARWLLAIGAPVALVVVWAVAIAPGAQNPIPQDLRVLLGSGLLLVAAGLLFAAGQGVPAIVLAVVVILDTVAMFLLRQ